MKIGQLFISTLAKKFLNSSKKDFKELVVEKVLEDTKYLLLSLLSLIIMLIFISFNLYTIYINEISSNINLFNTQEYIIFISMIVISCIVLAYNVFYLKGKIDYYKSLETLNRDVISDIRYILEPLKFQLKKESNLLGQNVGLEKFKN